MLIQFAWSIWKRKELAVEGDPWDGRTLEWATSSPPPEYNFAFTPVVHDADSWADMKKHGYQRPVTGFKAIHMPSSTGTGVILAALSTLCGFALIWYIWWLAGLGFIGIVAVAIAHTFNYKRDFYIPVEEVTRTEEERTRILAAGV